jgi:hypothetical protein
MTRHESEQTNAELGLRGQTLLMSVFCSAATQTPEAARNKHHAKADWQFATADARVKLKRLYPSL